MAPECTQTLLVFSLPIPCFVQPGTVCEAGSVSCLVSVAKERSKPPTLQIHRSTWSDYQQGCCATGSCKVEAGEKVLNRVQTDHSLSWTAGSRHRIFILLSSLSATLLSREYRRNLCLLSPRRWVRWGVSEERGGLLLGRGRYELPARRQTCLPSSKHRHRLSQRAAATTAAASRDFNELATILQPTYLPPAAAPTPQPVSFPPRSHPGCSQAAERGREELFIVCLLKMKGFYILMSTK